MFGSWFWDFVLDAWNIFDVIVVVFSWVAVVGLLRCDCALGSLSILLVMYCSYQVIHVAHMMFVMARHWACAGL